MHVKQGDNVRTGVEAFIGIWETIPGHGWMARLAKVPFLHMLAEVAYDAFAFVRPWLPRRKSDCAEGVCRR